ncbi:MAG: 30S ribosome-binding factor RbfA [Anaerolineae bacterium]|nr:30S ribosome-binding factor RbfA [Anaerolineae bacterium]
MSSIKQDRAAKLIMEIISNLLMVEVTDPALQSVTVTDVKVDREIEYADVYVHSLDDESEVMPGLERASGFLRRELAARTRFRRTPVLHFHWDVVVEHAQRIDELLDSLDIPPEDTPDTASSDTPDNAPDGEDASNIDEA